MLLPNFLSHLFATWKADVELKGAAMTANTMFGRVFKRLVTWRRNVLIGISGVPKVLFRRLRCETGAVNPGIKGPRSQVLKELRGLKEIFKRPGAVLQTLLLLINSVSQSVTLFLKIIKTPPLPNRKS